MPVAKYPTPGYRPGSQPQRAAPGGPSKPWVLPLTPVKPLGPAGRYLPPRNPGDVFKRIPREPIPFGNKPPRVPALPRIPRPRLPPLPGGPLLGLIDLFTVKPPRYEPPATWQRFSGPFRYPSPYDGRPEGWADQYWHEPLTGQAITVHPFDEPIPADRQWLGLWVERNQDVAPGPVRYAHEESWQRIAPATEPEPWIEIIEPLVLPEFLPGRAPALPSPKPRHPDTNWEPSQPRPSPQRQPVLRLSTDGTPANTRFSSLPDRRKPTSRPERKTILSVAGMSLLGRGVGALTESLDFIGAIWESVPPEERPYQEWRNGPITRRMYDPLTGKRETFSTWEGTELRNGERGYWKQTYNPSPTEKVGWLADNWQKIDPDQVVRNLVKNQIEDHLIGKMSQRTTRNLQPWLRRMKRPAGAFVGPAL